MRTSDFDYQLPAHLIAQTPLPERSASRLLLLDGADGSIFDRTMRELPVSLKAGDLIVFNNTRAIPAQLFATKARGSKVEVLIERLTGERVALVQARTSNPLRKGQVLVVSGGGNLRIVGRSGVLYVVESLGTSLLDLLHRSGHVRLPPYIRRPSTPEDRERHQSIFAATPGSVAAPTASLHFDKPLLASLARRGVLTAQVTLHVGAGTFKPVHPEDPHSHSLHSEWCEVTEGTVAAVQSARRRGSRVVAVGTTVVRTLETAAAGGHLEPWSGETDIFILPGFRFRVVDAIVTNFHPPRSSLLMLVCAAGGTKAVLTAYRHAVQRGYRFHSYGDAMFVRVHSKARA